RWPPHLSSSPRPTSYRDAPEPGVKTRLIERARLRPVTERLEPKPPELRIPRSGRPASDSPRCTRGSAPRRQEHQDVDDRDRDIPLRRKRGTRVAAEAAHPTSS